MRCNPNNNTIASCRSLGRKRGKYTILLLWSVPPMKHTLCKHTFSCGDVIGLPFEHPNSNVQSELSVLERENVSATNICTKENSRPQDKWSQAQNAAGGTTMEEQSNPTYVLSMYEVFCTGLGVLVMHGDVTKNGQTDAKKKRHSNGLRHDRPLKVMLKIVTIEGFTV